MSALAMILTAAMVVPGDGPEKVSEEMVQGLDLSGEWEGTSEYNGQKFNVRWSGGIMRSKDRPMCGSTRFPLVREGDGKLYTLYGKAVCPGIYKWEGENVVICISALGTAPRPTCFQTDSQYSLLILHRAKRGK